MSTTTELQFSTSQIWQEGGGRSPCGMFFSIDGFLTECFGPFTEQWQHGYQSVQRAITELDDRYEHRDPRSISVEDWNDNQGVLPELIVRVWDRSMEIMDS